MNAFKQNLFCLFSSIFIFFTLSGNWFLFSLKHKIKTTVKIINFNTATNDNISKCFKCFIHKLSSSWLTCYPDEKRNGILVIDIHWYWSRDQKKCIFVLCLITIFIFYVFTVKKLIYLILRRCPGISLYFSSKISICIISLKPRIEIFRIPWNRSGSWALKYILLDKH